MLWALLLQKRLAGCSAIPGGHFIAGLKEDVATATRRVHNTVSMRGLQWLAIEEIPWRTAITGRSFAVSRTHVVSL